MGATHVYNTKGVSDVRALAAEHVNNEGDGFDVVMVSAPELSPLRRWSTGSMP